MNQRDEQTITHIYFHCNSKRRCPRVKEDLQRIDID